MYLSLKDKDEIQTLVPERAELSSSIPILEGIVFWMVLGVIFFGVTLVWNAIGRNDVITAIAFVLLLPFVIVGLRKTSKLRRTKKRLADIDGRLIDLDIQSVSAQEKIDAVKGIYSTYSVTLTPANQDDDHGDHEGVDPMNEASYR